MYGIDRHIISVIDYCDENLTLGEYRELMGRISGKFLWLQGDGYITISGLESQLFPDLEELVDGFNREYGADLTLAVEEM